MPSPHRVDPDDYQPEPHQPAAAETEPGLFRYPQEIFSKISGQPEPDPLPGKWNVGRLLRRFAGSDERLLAWVPQERPRYTGLGGTVLFTALMAFVSMGIALSLAFGTRSPLVWLLAALWFLLILNFDRWIVSAPVPEHRWQKVPTIVVRMGMAFVFGIVIAEPLVLAVFNTAVEQKVHEVRAEELKAYRGNWMACNPDLGSIAGLGAGVAPIPGASAGPSAAPTAAPTPAPTKAPVVNGVDCALYPIPLPDRVRSLATERDQKKTQLTVMEAELATNTAEHTKLVDAAKNDCNGSTGHYGFGPVCRQLYATADAYWASHHMDQLLADVTARRGEVQKLSDEIQAESAAWAAKRDQYVDEQVQRWSQGRGDVGLLERIEALNLLSAKHLALALGIWAVRALFILVDLAPALAKFTSSTTTYDRLVSANLKLGELRYGARRAEDAADAEGWAEDAKANLAVGRARLKAQRTAEYETIMDDLEKHWARVPDHMGREGRRRRGSA
ncbi:hypothetical protein Rhe02_29160 [Rhizocola hellebori]|uniref:DUF4407 domain-containing protein n=1 Tax=Rhizocola hellebori TaxID=1392758 RepID=A0A8J3Q7H2_9ACTN|nr:DUF4407 domain-containing protein [Rhizocola hellebori]GIH04849.1 hypothetical protein Rhe02_29160 [Rhizocola hellebori]